MHQSTRALIGKFSELVRRLWAGRDCRVLDVGSAGANGTCRDLFAFADTEYVGMGCAPGPNIAVVVSDPYDWQEVADRSFDVAVSAHTFSHDEFPWCVMSQIAAKLKPGGLAMVVAPSPGPQHQDPTDCYRFLPNGMKALGKWAGLKVVDVGVQRWGAGLSDGSDQWTDCFGVFAKPAKAGQILQPPFTPDHVSQRKGAPLHRSSPYWAPSPGGYYESDRRDLDALLAKTRRPIDRALELGCAAGLFGERLRRLLSVGEYIGVEIDPTQAGLAASRLDRVIQSDLEEFRPASAGLTEESFDLLVALDVLEHLRDPWGTLARTARLLRSGGLALVSLPNVQNLSLVRDLVEGHWRYSAAGLLDVGHVRFFTWEGIEELIKGAGLEIVETQQVLGPLPLPKKLRPQGDAIRLGRLLLLGLGAEEVRRLHTYQYLVLARVAGGGAREVVS